MIAYEPLHVSFDALPLSMPAHNIISKAVALFGINDRILGSTPQTQNIYLVLSQPSSLSESRS